MLSFLNTGRTNANNLKIKLRFPKFIDKLCMDDLVFYAGGNIYRGSIDTSSNRYFRIVTFIFPPEASVGPYHPGNVQGSTGYVEFCIKVKQDHDVTSYGTRLKPYVAQVNFGHQSYLLRDFVDLLPDYKGKVGEAYRLADGPCGCTCKKRLAERDRNRRT